jgi:hypothetical protein
LLTKQTTMTVLLLTQEQDKDSLATK